MSYTVYSRWCGRPAAAYNMVAILQPCDPTGPRVAVGVGHHSVPVTLTVRERPVGSTGRRVGLTQNSTNRLAAAQEFSTSDVRIAASTQIAGQHPPAQAASNRCALLLRAIGLRTAGYSATVC